MKKILLWTGIGIGLFAVVVGITFVVFYYLEPVDEDLKVEMMSGDEKLAKEMIQTKQEQINLLQSELDTLRIQLADIQHVRDSLVEQSEFKDGLIREYQKTVDAMKTELAAETGKRVSIGELAKTYESMKVSEMQPILTKLDDQTVMDLYGHISIRNRKNILMALSASRAALITQKIAQK